MLGEALRLIRVYHDIKAKDLSKELGISQSYLSEIENEKKEPPIYLINKYAEFFKTKPSAILFFSENIESDNDSSLKASIKINLRKNIFHFLKVLENANQ